MKRAKRMDLFQSSIFTELKNMKLDYMKRTGNTTIDFSVGSPNIAPEPSIMKALQDAIMIPENYKYAINELPEMKAAIHDWYKDRYHVELTNDEMICLQGSQEALSTLFLAMCDPGDIVLVPDPYYPIFSDGPKIAGAKGLMGGEPYRIMELKPYIGVERATSSVILYVMMHIFSHFCFWLTSVLLYVCLYPVGWVMSVILGAITLFCLLVTVLFIKGYRHGMAVAFIRMGSRLPFLKKKVLHFAETHKEKLENIDKQIALLHRQKKRTFYSALFLEYTARVVSCLEIWLILNVLTTNVSFADCCLIAAFSSLLANLLFFLPMQLGGREGGFALAVGGLSLSGAYGVYAALITRVREMVWIVIGLALMKVGNRKGN